jgi:hypothetical protein
MPSVFKVVEGKTKYWNPLKLCLLALLPAESFRVKLLRCLYKNSGDSVRPDSFLLYLGNSDSSLEVGQKVRVFGYLLADLLKEGFDTICESES